MATLEDRVKQIEDRQALEDVLISLCTAIDSMSDIDGILACFTEDAVFDLTGIGMAKCEGHGEIRNFFKEVSAGMSHNGHIITNFAVLTLEENEAKCQCYTIGNGKPKEGDAFQLFVRYHLGYVRTSDGWKMNSFGESFLMPPPEGLGG